MRVLGIKTHFLYAKFAFRIRVNISLIVSLTIIKKNLKSEFDINELTKSDIVMLNIFKNFFTDSLQNTFED